jgi:hypothetical protein
MAEAILAMKHVEPNHPHPVAPDQPTRRAPHAELRGANARGQLQLTVRPTRVDPASS